MNGHNFLRNRKAILILVSNRDFLNPVGRKVFPGPGMGFLDISQSLILNRPFSERMAGHFW
jgi:hypothetical protein